MRGLVRVLLIVGVVMGLASPAHAKVKAADDVLVSDEFLQEQLSLIENTATEYQPVPSDLPACSALSKAVTKADGSQDDFAFEQWADSTQNVIFSQNARVFPGAKGAKKMFKTFAGKSQAGCLEAVNARPETGAEASVEKVKVKVKGADGVVAYHAEITFMRFSTNPGIPPTTQTFYAQYLMLRYENAVLDTYFASTDAQLFESGAELAADGARDAVKRID